MESTNTVTLLLQPGITTSNDDATLQASFRVLTLRDNRRVRWKEGTIDNEGMQKKSSKCCCVFTKRKNNDDDDDSYDEEDRPKNTKPASHSHEGDCSGYTE